MKKLFLIPIFLLLIVAFLTGCSNSNTATQTEDCDIKGNISSSGEKIYHLPGCMSYSKTKIDLGKGEEWFCSEKEARNAGWRKAYNCP